MYSENGSLFNSDLEEPEVIKNMARQAAKIAFYNFEWRYVTLVIFNAAQAIGVETFMKTYNKTVAVKFGEFSPQHRVPVPQYVLICDDNADIIRLLDFLVTNGYDNTGRYVLICLTMNEKDCSEYDVLKMCINKFKIYNVIFIKGTPDSENPVAYTVNPNIPEHCYNSDPKKLEMQLNCPGDDCFKDAYPEKLSNLYGCPVLVSTYEQYPFMYLHNLTQPPTGSDGELLQLLTTALNASLKIIIPEEQNWGHYKNNNWTGSVGDVFNKRAHFSMISAPLTYAKYGNFQISFTYNSMDMVWVAALPALKPSWEKLLYPLKIYIKIILLFMFMAIVLINTCLRTPCWRRIRNILIIGPPKSNMLFFSWILFLGMPTSKMPKKVALLSMVYSWIWFSFIIRSAYQAGLIGSLKQHAYKRNFVSFKDVLANKLPFGGVLTLREFYAENPVIYKRWLEVTSDELYPLLDKMSQGDSDFVLAVNKETVQEYMMYYGGKRALQIIPEKIVNSPTVLYFKKFSSLTPPINRILSAAVEVGFTGRLHAQFVSQGKAIFHRNKDHTAEPLRIEHFTGSIIILFGGWLVAAFFFAIEQFADRIDAIYFRRSAFEYIE